MKTATEDIIIAKYPVYKHSGTNWLGEIPKHWEILPGKRMHKVIKELNRNNYIKDILSLTLRGVVNNDPDSPEGLVPKDYKTYQIFNVNDLVFKLIDLENTQTSRVGLVHQLGIMSSAYIRLTPNEHSHAKYIYYFYYNLYLQHIYNILGSGVRSTLGPNDLLNLPCINPSKIEQTAIADFLDSKTEQINRAISQKEKQIELLKERRQILIHRAVTRGLDTNVPLKDSGVEWIGQIPQHWEVKRLKYILKERNERSDNGLEPLLMMSQTYGLVVREDFHEKAQVSASNIGNKIVYPSDLVFNKLKAHLGVFFKSTLDFKGLVSPDYAVYYPYKYIDDVKYLELLFRTGEYITQFIIRATGIVEGLIRLYTDELFNISVAVPPPSEQKEIIKYTHNITDKVDKAINCKIQEIEKLKEYKKVLVNEAVTGKIKVV